MTYEFGLMIGYFDRFILFQLESFIYYYLATTRHYVLIRARSYKTFFMLNSVENEILKAHKYKNIKKFSYFSNSDKPKMLLFLFIYVTMPTIVGILTFMSRKYFMLNWVEHEKSFITSGPEDITMRKNGKQKLVIIR